MPVYCFYADAEHKRRTDGCNTVIAAGVTGAAARTVAETLLGEPGTLTAFAAVDLTAAPAFAVQGNPPLGARAQTVWPNFDRGGSYLKGT